MSLQKKLETNEFLYSDYPILDELSGDIEPLVDKNQDIVPIAIQHWPYDVSAYPILLNHDFSHKLSTITSRISHLLCNVPKLYFDNNVEQIADYYFCGDREKAREALSHLRRRNLCARLDIVLTEAGFKVLEVNLGASLGGSEIQCFDPVVRKTHQTFFELHKFSSPRYLNSFAKFVYDSAVALKNSASINIFLSDRGIIDSSAREVVRLFFKSLVIEITGNKQIEVFLDNPSQLKYKDKLCYNEDSIDVVLLLGANERVTPAIAKAHVKGQVFTPDHYGLDILSSKKNLVLLYRLALQGTFRAQDNELILSCVPWAHELVDVEVHFGEERLELVELLLSRKDDFVIKPAFGSQGDGVVVGRYVTEQDWGEALKFGLVDGDYIVQEYCDSVQITSYNTENHLSNFVPIWGAFCFSQQYAGVMVRMTEAGTVNGVVNGSRGLSALVYEQT